MKTNEQAERSTQENGKTADQIWWDEFLGQPEDPAFLDTRPQYGPWYPEETE